jgi:chemotaxis signal transduction protein
MPELFLQIHLANHTLGMNAKCISRIVPVVALVTPPNTPPEFEGFLNIGGEYGSVFNLWQLLLIPIPPISVHDYLVIFSCPEEACFGAFRIDTLPTIRSGEIMTHPSIDETVFAGFANTADGQLLILKPAFFFTDSLKQHAQMLIQSLAELDRQPEQDIVESIR